MNTALQLALTFIKRGWSPIPVEYRGKAAGEGWPDLRITAATAGKYFGNGPMNVGVLTGAASGGLADLDLDCDEAVELARYFAPESNCAFGRASRRRSHIEYLADGPFDSLKLADPDLESTEATIIELRGDARQTVFPGSVHESGEPVTWDSDGEPGRASVADLTRAVKHIAAATLLVRCWHEGVHDDLATALIGCLLRAGWPDDEIENFVAAIVEVAGDPKAHKRLSKIERLRQKLEADEGKGVPGLPSLIQHMGSERRARLVVEWIDLTPDDPRLHVVLRSHGSNEIVDTCLDVLAKRGIEAHVFARAGQLVRPHFVERPGFKDTKVQSLELEPLTISALQYEINKLIQFTRHSRGAKDSERITKQDCPVNIAQTILDIPYRWGALPYLHAMASVPIYLGDGRLLATPGYHRERGIWLTCPEGISVPQPVTRELAEAALARLREWIAEFPFASDLSEGVMIAAMMTAALRPSLPAAPGFVFDAPKHGIGKSTAAKVVNIIGTGRLPAVMEFHRNEEELRKSIDAAQMQGRESMTFDNVPVGLVVSSATLAQTLSEPERDPRVLGISANRTVPCTQLVMLTGNNISVAGELARRLLAARLEPALQSLTRTFKRPDLLAELQAQRAQVLSDIFTIAAGGAYGTEAPPALVGFGQWGHWVQHPLVALGVADPVLSALEQEAEDPVQVTRNSIIALWHQLHGSRFLKAKDLTSFKGTIEEHTTNRPLYWELKELLKEVAGEGHEKVVNTRLLGDWLRVNRGIWSDDGLRIELVPGKSGHPAKWRVFGRRVAGQGGQGGLSTPAPDSNSSSSDPGSDAADRFDRVDLPIDDDEDRL